MENLVQLGSPEQVKEVKLQLDRLNDWMQSSQEDLLKKVKTMYHYDVNLQAIVEFMDTVISNAFHILDIDPNEVKINLIVKDVPLELLQLTVQVDCMGLYYRRVIDFKEAIK